MSSTPAAARPRFLERFALGPGSLRFLLNVWPPFRAAGIRVRAIAPDYRWATVELRMKLFNRNYVGTHFGGSLFAMTDPFCMLLMMHRLGPGYVVWDKAASIRFLKPARGTVTARIELDDVAVGAARAAADASARHEPTFRIPLVDAQGVVVAEVEKTLHIRKR